MVYIARFPYFVAGPMGIFTSTHQTTIESIFLMTMMCGYLWSMLWHRHNTVTWLHQIISFSQIIIGVSVSVSVSVFMLH